MLAASPVTASIAVTSLETIFSAVRFSSTFWLLSRWSLLPHAERQNAAAAAVNRGKRISGFSGFKKEAAGNNRQPLEMPTPPAREAKELHRVVRRRVGRRRRCRRRRAHV